MKATKSTYEARTAQSRRSTMGRLLLLTLFLCTFLGGARAQYETHWPDFDYDDYVVSGKIVFENGSVATIKITLLKSGFVYANDGGQNCNLLSMVK